MRPTSSLTLVDPPRSRSRFSKAISSGAALGQEPGHFSDSGARLFARPLGWRPRRSCVLLVRPAHWPLRARCASAAFQPGRPLALDPRVPLAVVSRYHRHLNRAPRRVADCVSRGLSDHRGGLADSTSRYIAQHQDVWRRPSREPAPGKRRRHQWICRIFAIHKQVRHHRDRRLGRTGCGRNRQDTRQPDTIRGYQVVLRGLVHSVVFHSACRSEFCARLDGGPPLSYRHRALSSGTICAGAPEEPHKRAKPGLGRVLVLVVAHGQLVFCRCACPF